MPDDRVRVLPSPDPRVRLWALDLQPRAGDSATAALDEADRQRLAGSATAEAGRFLARRALLRVVVAQRAAAPVGAFGPGAGSGPWRVDVPGRPGWYASVSSSGDLAVLALADVPVGVDVERRPGPADAVLVARELLPPPELAWVVEGGADAPERFLDTWVRKEAVVKCTGEGLARDLRSFVVDAGSEVGTVVLPDAAVPSMRVAPLVVPGCAAALAVGD